MWLRGLNRIPRCSFCHKKQDTVRLIPSPRDYTPRAFICAECIAVCSRALGAAAVPPPAQTPQRRVAYAGFSPADAPSVPVPDPLAGQFLSLVDRWSRRQAGGQDSSVLLAEMHRVIDRLLARQRREP
jgi:ClpX C4-type zinc finger